jgi:hypothetical protein
MKHTDVNHKGAWPDAIAKVSIAKRSFKTCRELITLISGMQPSKWK